MHWLVNHLFVFAHIAAATVSVREQNLHLVSFIMWYAETAFRIFHVFSCKLAFITVHFSRRHWHHAAILRYNVCPHDGIWSKIFCLTNRIEYHTVSYQDDGGLQYLWWPMVGPWTMSSSAASASSMLLWGKLWGKLLWGKFMPRILRWIWAMLWSLHFWYKMTVRGNMSVKMSGKVF